MKTAPLGVPSDEGSVSECTESIAVDNGRGARVVDSLCAPEKGPIGDNGCIIKCVMGTGSHSAVCSRLKTGTDAIVVLNLGEGPAAMPVPLMNKP